MNYFELEFIFSPRGNYKAEMKTAGSSFHFINGLLSKFTNRGISRIAKKFNITVKKFTIAMKKQQ